MLNGIAKAPVQATGNWVQSSLAGIADAPGMLVKRTQAFLSLLARDVLALPADWFIIFKAVHI